MTIEQLQKLLEKNAEDATEEFRRIFHGRGGLYEEWKHLTVDSIDTTLSIALYFQEESEDALLEMLERFVLSSRYDTLVVQRRYLKGSPSEVIKGELSQEIFAIENGMKLKLNLLSNQNSFYFPDMKNGRAFVRENAKEKNILNLFSYTCAFSVAAKLGGAKSVVNIDMSKAALSVGRANHHLNDIKTQGVNFLPYNILKSFSRIRKKGPYDLIVIDPPTFQKGSFEATKDYQKIIKKLSEIASQECTLLACLNSPDLDSRFLIELMHEFAPEFTFVKRLENPKEFASKEEQRSLKNLVFKKM